MNKPQKSFGEYTQLVGNHIFGGKTAKACSERADADINLAFTGIDLYTPMILLATLPNGVQVIGTLWRDPTGFCSKNDVVGPASPVLIKNLVGVTCYGNNINEYTHIHNSFVMAFIGRCLDNVGHRDSDRDYMIDLAKRICSESEVIAATGDIDWTFGYWRAIRAWEMAGFNPRDNRVVEKAVDGVLPSDVPGFIATF